VLTLLKQAIRRKSATSNGFLIDGYPRELDQGRRFEAEVAPVERVIYFQVCSSDIGLYRASAQHIICRDRAIKRTAALR